MVAFSISWNSSTFFLSRRGLRSQLDPFPDNLEASSSFGSGES